MCLVSKNKEPFIADKDITCYKIIHRFPNFWVSPVINQYFRYGHLIDNSPIIISNNLFNYYIIESGFFHAFNNKKYAEEVNEEFNNTNKDSEKTVVLECIIPKGTKYYIGKDNDICTSEIIINNNEKEI